MTPVTVQHEPGPWCNRGELEGKGTVYDTRKTRCVKRGRPPDKILKTGKDAEQTEGEDTTRGQDAARAADERHDDNDGDGDGDGDKRRT